MELAVLEGLLKALLEVGLPHGLHWDCLQEGEQPSQPYKVLPLSFMDTVNQPIRAAIALQKALK